MTFNKEGVLKSGQMAQSSKESSWKARRTGGGGMNGWMGHCMKGSG